jgi:hypothetical protein
MTMADVDEMFPRWIRVSSREAAYDPGATAVRGRFGWAGYGRLCGLRQLLANSPGAVIPVGERWQMQSLAASLGMSVSKCGELLRFMADVGCIDPESLSERGEVFDNGVFRQVEAYQTKAAVARKNGKSGGFHT